MRAVILRDFPRAADAGCGCTRPLRLFKALRRRFSLEYHGGMAKKLSKLPQHVPCPRNSPLAPRGFSLSPSTAAALAIGAAGATRRLSFFTLD